MNPSDPLLSSVREQVAASRADEDGISVALKRTGRVLGSSALSDLTRSARAELSGAGPLQPLAELSGCTDVLLNGPDETFVDRGAGLERAELHLGTPAAARALAMRLAALAGQRLDDAAPICDGTLPDGTRLHAIVAPLVPADRGAMISLRILRQSALSLERLRELAMFPADWEPLLRGLVARRANVLISGGTGAGKTTLLAAMLGLVPPGERIVTVEEARELAPQHPHVVSLMARRANVEGAGEVSLSELVRAALRMRPDRIVVGECRGAEVREMLLALNTGHDGGLATIHANAVEHVPARLEALAALAGMSRKAVAAQAVAALDVILHLGRADGRRHLQAVGVLGLRASGLKAVSVARWDAAGAPRVLDAPAWEALQRRWLHD